MLSKTRTTYGAWLTFVFFVSVQVNESLAYDPLADGDFGGVSLQDEIPVALTAARLKQPRAEVPALP